MPLHARHVGRRWSSSPGKAPAWPHLATRPGRAHPSASAVLTHEAFRPPPVGWIAVPAADAGPVAAGIGRLAHPRLARPPAHWSSTMRARWGRRFGETSMTLVSPAVFRRPEAST